MKPTAATQPAHRILLAGALAVEVKPLISRLKDRQVLSDRLTTGRIGAWDVGVVRVGVGRARAEQRTRDALALWDADWVVSIGTCGSLADDLWLGQLVTARRVLDQEPSTLRVLPVLRPVHLITVDQVVDSQAARLQLAGRGAQVCDMEAAGVQAAAGARTFSALKVVSDHAGGRRDLVFARRLLPQKARFGAFQVRAAALCGLRLVPWLTSILSQPRH